MNVGIYRAAVALVGHERRLDAIAFNLANVGSTGFKRVRTAGHEFSMSRDPEAVRGQEVPRRTDFTQGDLVRTDNPLDLALSGNGFFAVEGADGELLTRDGQFHLTETGELLDPSDRPLAWTRRGGPIDPAGPPIVVDHDGTVRQGENELGQLRVVDFEDPHSLQQVRGGYWVAPVGAREVTHTASVRQYSLEQSNAVGTEEIIEMIGVQRSFESTANLIKSIQRSYARLTQNA